MSETPKVVLDTQVYLRALINPKSICGTLVFNLDTDYTLYVTDIIKSEIIDVLNRPRIRAKFPQITDIEVRCVAMVLELAHSVLVKPEEIEAICRDPKDDIFLACAKAAGADYLVSEDKDLLVIGQHHKTQRLDVVTFIDILRNKDTT